MAYYANQKTIEITNEHINQVAHAPQNDNNKFLRAINWQHIEWAQQILTGNEFTVLVYIMKWAGQGYYDFSPAGIELATQMSDSTASRCFMRLEQLGYIKRLPDRNNRYEIDLCPPGIEEVAKHCYAENVINRTNKKKVIPKLKDTFIS